MTHGRLESNLPWWQDSVCVVESGVQRTWEEGETSGPWAVANGAILGLIRVLGEELCIATTQVI